MTIAIYPASFDPITYGHIDIAARAAKSFSKVIAAIHQEPAKNVLFSASERLVLTRQALAHLDNIEVQLYKGITVHFAKQVGATVMVRGLRTMMDFEAEKQLSWGNHQLDSDIDTVCLISNQNYAYISSSLVKDIALNGGDIEQLTPPHVVMALQERYHQT